MRVFLSLDELFRNVSLEVPKVSELPNFPEIYIAGWPEIKVHLHFPEIEVPTISVNGYVSMHKDSDQFLNKLEKTTKEDIVFNIWPDGSFSHYKINENIHIAHSASRHWSQRVNALLFFHQHKERIVKDVVSLFNSGESEHNRIYNLVLEALAPFMPILGADVLEKL